MFRLLRTLSPACYHGHGEKPPFFEGWYFKLVTPGGERSLAVIPGVFLAPEEEHSQAFIQIFDGRSGSVTFHPYPLSEFHAVRSRKFDLHIGPNHFSSGYMFLDIQGEGRRVHGEIRMIGITPWPVTLFSPGIMGWYAWMPFMQCYHGVVSLDHSLEGQLEVDGELIHFTNGRGYTEKDWGRAFPESWIWVQSNHFSETGTALTASVATIPWIRGEFPGFIIGLWRQGKLYRFATYTGAHIRHLEIGEEKIRWIVEDRRRRLDIYIFRADKKGALRAPTSTGMNRTIEESLEAQVGVHLVERDRRGEERVIVSDLGYHAGFEAVGDLERLVALWAADRKVNSKA